MPVRDTSCMMMHISQQSDNRATIFFDFQFMTQANRVIYRRNPVNLFKTKIAGHVIFWIIQICTKSKALPT